MPLMSLTVDKILGENFMKTKQVVFTDKKQVEFIEYELGNLADNAVLCKTKISGISHGTEMTGYLGYSPFIERTIVGGGYFRDKVEGDPDFFPYKWVGYDAVGIVEEVGKDVTKYKVGDRVWCQMRHQTYFIFNEDAADAIKLPDRVTDIEGATVNLSSISLNGILDAEIKLGDNVVVFGGGFVGLMAVQFAVLSGAKSVVLIEPDEKRRKVVSGYKNVIALPMNGEKTTQDILNALNGLNPDVSIDCSGVPAGLNGAIKVAGKEGRVVAVGFYSDNARNIVFGEEFIHNRINIIASMSKWGCANRFSRWNEARILNTIVELFAKNEITVDNMETKIFNFAQAKDAYELLESDKDKPLKAIFVYDE